MRQQSCGSRRVWGDKTACRRKRRSSTGGVEWKEGLGAEESMRINGVRRKEGHENGTRGEISWAVDMTTGWDRFQGQEKASPFPFACALSHPFCIIDRTSLAFRIILHPSA